MTHKEIEQQDVIERYVRRKLSVDDRAAFQDHFFTCDQCFDRVQLMERFVNGVHHAADAGILAGSSAATSAAPSPRFGWLRPAFLLPAMATLILAFAVGWLLLFRMPAMRDQLASERQAQELAQQENQRKLNEVAQQLQRERDERAKLETQLAQTQKSPQQSSSPARESSARRKGLAPQSAPTPSETETSEAEATRSSSARSSGASLAAVKRIYVEATGDDDGSRQTRDLLAAGLEPSKRFTVTGNKGEADAVLKLSVTLAASTRNQTKLNISVKLVNAGGAVIWPASGRSKSYQGSAQNISNKLVNDLLRDAGRR